MCLKPPEVDANRSKEKIDSAARSKLALKSRGVGFVLSGESSGEVIIEQFAPQNVTRFVRDATHSEVPSPPLFSSPITVCVYLPSCLGGRGEKRVVHHSLTGLLRSCFPGFFEQTLRVRTLLPSTKNDPLFRHFICEALWAYLFQHVSRPPTSGLIFLVHHYSSPNNLYEFRTFMSIYFSTLDHGEPYHLRQG